MKEYTHSSGVGRVKNHVCHYIFVFFSYFALFYTYKKDGRTKIFFVKKYGFIVCKRNALKKLNQRKKLEIQIM